MVISILLLTVSLILTFGKSSIRFFDRLGISFSFAILLQFTLLVVAILPHLKLQDGKSVIMALCYFLLFMIAVVYFLQNKSVFCWNFIVVTIVSMLLYLGAFVVLSRVLTSGYGISLLLSMMLIASVFAFSLRFKTAFLSTFAAFILASFFAIFTPLYYAIEAQSIHVILIDSLIPALFVLMFVFNAFRRERVVEKIC